MIRSTRTYRLASLLIAGAFFLNAAGPIVHYLCAANVYMMHAPVHHAEAASEAPVKDTAQACTSTVQNLSDASPTRAAICCEVETAYTEEAVVTRLTAPLAALHHIGINGATESNSTFSSSRTSARSFSEHLAAGATPVSSSLQILNATFLL